MALRMSMVAAALWTSAAIASPAWAACPSALEGASRVILVTGAGMGSRDATLRRFERTGPGGAWREVGVTVPAVVGATGLGWATGATDATPGEPRKHEGDKRTPAGVFRLGRPFGFAASARPGYLHLEPDRAVCVDDLASPHYGQIVSRRDVPGARGEDMGRISLYRRGFLIDYPVDAAARSGSCIFLHVWRGPGKGTVGCVAAPEAAVASLQDWAEPGDVVAILPRARADEVAACLASTASTARQAPATPSSRTTEPAR